MSSSKSATKKPKTAGANDEFETVKRYLLECPHFTPDHPAIKAALDGIEKEEQRKERDARLQLKFAKEATLTQTSTSASAAPQNPLDESVVVVDKAPSPMAASNTDEVDSDEMLEWQDVAEKKEDEADGTSFLGKELAKASIDAISEFHVQVPSPVAAIALALHASLRSSLLEFSCTGVPEDSLAQKGGFAAPIRELPKTQFLPQDWAANPGKVALRYRKNGTGALVLTVQRETDGKNVTVQLHPANSKEPLTETLTFALEDHINLDSWNAAKDKSSSASIPPALHYKSLATLLSKFCRIFDLGSVKESDGTPVAQYVDNTVQSIAGALPTTTAPIHKSDFVPSVSATAPTDSRSRMWKEGTVPATLGDAFPGLRAYPHTGGDFGDDLTPAGLRDPRFAPAPGRMSGNLMGPNHPLFQGGAGGLHGPPVGGPGSMQPRFDPVYPPSIDPDQFPEQQRRSRPSRTGEPNPDHLPPPNSLGHDMFS